MSNCPDTPKIPSSTAILRIQNTTTINAPIEKVWETLTDTSTFPKWNRFIPRVSIREQPDTSQKDNPDPILKKGTRFTFHVNMYPEQHAEPQPQKSGLRDTLLVLGEYEPPSLSSELESSESGSSYKKARITWSGDGPAQGFIMSSLLEAERVHELREVEIDGKVVTEVTNWELQRGYLAYVVKGLYGGRLEMCFGVWAGGLKEFCEGGEIRA